MFAHAENAPHQEIEKTHKTSIKSNNEYRKTFEGKHSSENSKYKKKHMDIKSIRDKFNLSEKQINNSDEGKNFQNNSNINNTENDKNIKPDQIKNTEVIKNKSQKTDNDATKNLEKVNTSTKESINNISAQEHINKNIVEEKHFETENTKNVDLNTTDKKSGNVPSIQETNLEHPTIHNASSTEPHSKEQQNTADNIATDTPSTQANEIKNKNESKTTTSAPMTNTESVVKSEQNHQLNKHENDNTIIDISKKTHTNEKHKVGFKNKNHSKPLPDFVVSSQEVKMLENISSRKYYSNDVSSSDKQRTNPFYSVEYSTMLFHAVFQNDCFAIAALLQKGGNINAQLTNGDSVLLYAIKNNRVEVAKYLVLKGADINLQNTQKETPLHIAIKAGNLECTSLLLYYNADVFIKDKDGKTPLSYLKSSDTGFCIQVFSMYTNKEKALIDASRMGLLSGTRYIIKSGIKPTVTDEKGNTPLMLAVKNGDIKMVSLLLEYGGEQLKIANKVGETAMSIAENNNRTDIVSILKTFQIQEEFRKS
ncbi:ankyrin repeat domain-containing protein [Candidatus Fokinia crypta]|uniref:Ankyrin repeats protein n=1 Tax=Candidatus Fokinia crypta TaxID=1920990 RepID=A0ABZ0UR80_9RICK|nr:ankyrin repeat domain-containing protein [Candidatus Fokinia cryptica]WPX97756.1 Ankyrin repeats protein [Candidatus Fokinia cryptica]